MSEQVSNGRTPRKPIVFLCVVAFAAMIAWSASGDVRSSASETSPTEATPSGIRLRIDIGPVREIAPIFKRENDEDVSEFMHLVEDPNGILSRDQARVLAEDAHRLSVHGIPTMFVLRESPQSPEESAIHADSLRTDRHLETTPGADDGLLFLVTQNAEGPRQSMFVTISYGAQTFPKGGLNEQTLQDVYQQSIRPRIRFGLVADALKIGIRKIIYLETYHPDPDPPLSSLQRATQSTLSVAAPILIVGGIVSGVIAWRSPKTRSTSSGRFERRREILAMVIAGTTLIVVAILSVHSQSRIGIATVCAGVLTFAVFVCLIARSRRGPIVALRHLRVDSHVRSDRSSKTAVSRKSSIADPPRVRQGRRK